MGLTPANACYSERSHRKKACHLLNLDFPHTCQNYHTSKNNSSFHTPASFLQLYYFLRQILHIEQFNNLNTNSFPDMKLPAKLQTHHKSLPPCNIPKADCMISISLGSEFSCGLQSLRLQISSAKHLPTSRTSISCFVTLTAAPLSLFHTLRGPMKNDNAIS